MPTGATEGMRVVFVTHNYPRHADDVAGAFLHPLALALKDRGADVRVVAPSDRGAGGHALLDGIPVRRVRYASAARERYAYTGTMADAIRSPGGLVALVGLVRALRAGVQEELRGATRAVVHAHWWIPGGLAAPQGVPLVCTCHGTDVRLIDRSAAARWMARGPMRRAAVVTTVSTPFARIIASRMHRTVPADAIQPMPVRTANRPRTTGGGGIVVLGRLTDQKRVDLAIDAWQHARTAGMVLPLTIAGDGPARSRLEQHAASRVGDGAIHFLGEVPPADVPALLATADVMLMPARDEGLGLAAAEALMQGVPVVVCRDGGGVLDVVPSGGGGRQAAPDAAAIATALMELLADPGAHDAAAATGEQWQERLDPGFVADRAMDWYRRALDE